MSERGRTQRKDFNDRREWILDDYEVNYIHLDYRFGFDVYGYGCCLIIIGVPFVLACGGVETIHMPDDLDSIAGALKVLHKKALRIAVHRSGTLVVDFDGDLQLRVDKHQEHEAWEAHGEGELFGIQFMCTPHDGPPWREDDD